MNIFTYSKYDFFFHRHGVDSQGNLLDESVFDPDDARRCRWPGESVNRWDLTKKPYGGWLHVIFKPAKKNELYDNMGYS